MKKLLLTKLKHKKEVVQEVAKGTGNPGGV